LVCDVAERKRLSGDEASALLRVVGDYASALDLLDAYDNQCVKTQGATHGPVQAVTLDEARQTIARLRQKYGATELFGREKDQSLASSLSAVMQSYAGRDVYPTLEEKAAHLLYFLVKNHSFVDGNKRIAAALFLWFLEKNRALYDANGRKRLADGTLVAVTLLIAESQPAEKLLITAILTNLLNPAQTT
jgi:prophage maintenance system killer protein